MGKRERWLALASNNKWNIVLFVALFLSFNFNIFGHGLYAGWYEKFQADSSAIIVKTTECPAVISSYSGPVVPSPEYTYNEIMMEGGCVSGEFKPYGSQFGLQSYVLRGFSSLFSNYERGLKVAEILLSVVFALLLVILVQKLRTEFTRVPAIAVAVGLVLSPWLTGFSHNLYWVIFTIFLPFVFSLYTYRYFKVKNTMPVFYGILFVLFLLKFLSGYEYASTIVFSAFIPIAYYELKVFKLSSLAKLWREALFVAAVGGLGLILAISANVAGLKNYAGGWGNALSIVTARADARAGAEKYQRYVINSMKGTTPGVYRSIDRVYNLAQLEDGQGSKYKYILISTINYAMLPAFNVPFKMSEPFATIIQSIFTVGLVAGAMLYRLRGVVSLRRVYEKLAAMYWLGLLGAISWLVLMPGHTFVHPHINAIVFYLPFLIVCYLIIGLYIQTSMSKKIRKKS